MPVPCLLRLCEDPLADNTNRKITDIVISQLNERVRWISACRCARCQCSHRVFRFQYPILHFVIKVVESLVGRVCKYGYMPAEKQERHKKVCKESYRVSCLCMYGVCWHNDDVSHSLCCPLRKRKIVPRTGFITSTMTRGGRWLRSMALRWRSLANGWKK